MSFFPEVVDGKLVEKIKKKRIKRFKQKRAPKFFRSKGMKEIYEKVNWVNSL